ncbi:MAG TPA: response regulator [Azospira sp.]|nr:response regulator [Azospira sp.]
MKVLVVDDHKVNRMLPRAILGKLGVEVLEADSGEAALEYLAAAPALDHLLLDVSMPGLTGLEVCRRLRERQETRNLHIIAYTAHASAEEKSQIMAAGFDDLLLKPINREGLLRALGLA